MTVPRPGNGLPVWERLRAPDARPLRILAVHRGALEVAHVVDGELTEIGATVFDAWVDHDIVTLRAARIDDVTVTPFEVTALRLEVEYSDGRLEAVLAGAGAVVAPAELERLACACRGVSADMAYRAVGNGWSTAEQVKRATRIAFGVCQGRRCVPWLAERLDLPLDDPRAQITPRPPLVPLPASVLASFVSQEDR